MRYILVCDRCESKNIETIVKALEEKEVVVKMSEFAKMKRPLVQHLVYITRKSALEM